MAIVSEFSRQVLVLKPTSKFAGLSGRQKGLQRRLIDQHQTSGFPKHCADLSAAKSGNKALEESLVRMDKEASEHLGRVMSDVAKLPEAINDLVKDFARHELDVIRKGDPLSRELANKIIKQAMTTAAILGVNHPQSRGFPLLMSYLTPSFYASHFLVLSIWSIESSSAASAKQNRRNCETTLLICRSRLMRPTSMAS